MIITILPDSDTYVTNLHTDINDASHSNVGRAATLDIFKLYNENKNAYSWAGFEFTSPLNNQSNLTLTDSFSNNIDFVFDATSNTSDGSIDINGNVIVGINDIQDHTSQNPSYASRLKQVIESINEKNNGLNFNIDAYSNSRNILLLKQQKQGDIGDTSFTLPNGMSSIGNLNNFARIEYSAILIKFDIENFKSNWINLDENNNILGAFSNLKAELVLKDITSGQNKPYDYDLEVLNLRKPFREGKGKDTIYFSDKDSCNFKELSVNQSWSIENFITLEEDVDLIDNNQIVKNIKVGNENLVFDITDQIKQIILGNQENNGILIRFTDEYLYNNFSYFVKRLGSRHLLNKDLIPNLNIKIKDTDYFISNNKEKTFYFNQDESLFLFNYNDKLVNFSKPTANSVLLFNLQSSIGKKTILSELQTDTALVNYKGNTITGSAKVNLNVSRYNKDIDPIIDNEYANFVQEWFWQDSEFEFIDSTNIESGIKYKIKTVGSIDYTTIGASNNNIGTIFTSNNILNLNIDDPGFVNGEVFVVKEEIFYRDNISFYISNTEFDKDNKNLISAISIRENIKNNFNTSAVLNLHTYFIDSKKSLRATKLTSEIKSENLGKVYYEVYDKETNKKLIEFDFIDDSTLMFFDGEKYLFNFYVPESFLKKKLIFKFAYFDEVNNDIKYISSINSNSNIISIE